MMDVITKVMLTIKPNDIYYFKKFTTCHTSYQENNYLALLIQNNQSGPDHDSNQYCLTREFDILNIFCIFLN